MKRLRRRAAGGRDDGDDPASGSLRHCGGGEAVGEGAVSKGILVAGLGRCGSSLTMQMLQAAGVECLGDFPAFEPEEVGFSRRPHLLMACLSGRAAKILDPHRDIDQWPQRIDARVIWLDRDAREQAKSQLKFVRLMAGLDIPGQQWRAMRAGLLADRKRCQEWLDRCTPTPLVMRFEDILRSPITAAVEMASFLGLPAGSENAMAARVLQREPQCQPGLEIELKLCAEVA
jgi:hypothetical protein